VTTNGLMIFLLSFLSILFLTNPGDKPVHSDAVMERIQKELSVIYQTDEFRFQVIEKWVPQKLKSLEPAKMQSVKFESSKPKGYQMIRISFQERGIIEEVTIQVFIEVKRYLPVAARRIMPGEPVAANLFTMQWIDISRLRDVYISDIKLIEGKTTQSLIRKGSILQLKDFKEKPLIEPGDLVKMQYTSKGISVIIPCFAQSFAAKGEQIKLFNKETGEHYIGQVQSAQKVMWEKTL